LSHKIRKNPTTGIPEECVVCQLRKLYDPSGYQTVRGKKIDGGERGCVRINGS